jgi:uncharacterized protein YjcR
MSERKPMQSTQAHAICGAKTRNGGQCQSKPMLNGRCRMHGGASPKGHESPQFKTGMRSKYLPTRLGAIYEEIESDLEANILSRNIRLREALIRQNLKLIEDAPDAAQAWNDLRKELDNLTAHFSNEDYGKVAISLDKLGRMVDERQLYHQSVAEIRKDLNEQRNDTSAKAAITLKGENAIGVNELMVFVGAIMNLISTTVSNASERNRIYDAIERLTSASERNPSQLVEAKTDASAD